MDCHVAALLAMTERSLVLRDVEVEGEVCGVGFALVCGNGTHDFVIADVELYFVFTFGNYKFLAKNCAFYIIQANFCTFRGCNKQGRLKALHFYIKFCSFCPVNAYGAYFVAVRVRNN